MSGRFLSGWPPPWLRNLLHHAERWTEERRQAGARWVRETRVAAGTEWRRRWPAARATLLAANDRVDRWVTGFPARLTPAFERLTRGARRHAPTLRQVGLVGLVVLGAAWLLWERCGLAGCPDVARLASYQPGGASVLLDHEGERFADLAPVEYEMVPLDSLPPYLPQAFVAVEDRRFFEHGGVDWTRVLGATWADLRAGALVEGSSTIPMQLARTLFPDRIRREEKTFRRKLLEVRVAREIEDRYSKHEILELYLNHVYLGGGAYGVQAASRYYFGTRAEELTLEEAALLAALPKAPSMYDPRRHPDAAKTRRDLVLTRMEEQGLLAFDEAEDARASEVRVPAEAELDPDGDRLAPYFVEHVRGLLEDSVGSDLYSERLRVFTTLDPRAQEAAETELAAQLRAVERGAFGWFGGDPYPSGDADSAAWVQGAVVIMDPRTGDVRAWVGGRDFDASRYDRARLARRQAGSAFKPFVYAAALEAGLSPSQPILDAPYRLAGGRDWEPENYSGGFEGRMSMREALVRSQNVPAVRLAAAVGTDPVASVARRAGIGDEVPASPVAALGVTTVSPAEMAAAYSAFATLGTRVEPRFVLRVEDEDGEVVWESRPPERAEVLAPGVAFLLTDMLRDVVDRGTGTAVRHAGYRGPAAGKTGTTSDATDVWFVGYTPELVGVVWVGFDEVRPLPSRATGGGVAAPVWGRIMARAYGDRTAPGWSQAPQDVVTVRIDPETGMALQDGCRPRWDSPRSELFLEGREPAAICPRRRGDYLFDRIGGWLGSVFGREREPLRVPGDPDPDLGVPRLPLRGEIEEPEPVHSRWSPSPRRSGRFSQGRSRYDPDTRIPDFR